MNDALTKGSQNANSYHDKQEQVGFQILTKITMKNAVSFRLQRRGFGTDVSENTSPLILNVEGHLTQEPSLPSLPAGCLLCVLINTEYGTARFLRNVGLSPNYTALRHRMPRAAS